MSTDLIEGLYAAFDRRDGDAMAAAAHDDRSARWIARYTFTPTGRKVVNDVRATFAFGEDGLIAEHIDDFSFWKWARQALGPAGVALGWTPLLRRKVGGQARAGRRQFRAR